jgi:hypothetical protein
MDAAVPMDAQNAPTGTWKTAQNAVSHSAHTHHRVFWKKKEQERELRRQPRLTHEIPDTPMVVGARASLKECCGHLRDAVDRGYISAETQQDSAAWHGTPSKRSEACSTTCNHLKPKGTRRASERDVPQGVRRGRTKNPEPRTPEPKNPELRTTNHEPNLEHEPGTWNAEPGTWDALVKPSRSPMQRRFHLPGTAWRSPVSGCDAAARTAA